MNWGTLMSILAIFLLFFAGCSSEPSSLYYESEDPCGYNNTEDSKNYEETDPNVCAQLSISCNAGHRKFFNNCGCGCAGDLN